MICLYLYNECSIEKYLKSYLLDILQTIKKLRPCVTLGDLNTWYFIFYFRREDNSVPRLIRHTEKCL